MKVLIISAAFPPMRAGEAYHVLHLSQHLADRGLDIHVLTTKGNGLTGDFPFRVYPLMRNWSWLDLPRLAKFLKGCSPDAVLLIYSDSPYNSHPMITFAPTLVKALMPSTVFVTQFENEYSSLCASRVTRALLKAIRQYVRPENIDYTLGTLLRASDRIIVLSQRHLLQLSGSFAGVRSKTVVIPPPPIMRMYPGNNGVSRQRGREALGVRPDDVLIAHFGYIYSNRGVETLLTALQIVCNQRGNVRLLMIGGRLAASASPAYAQEIDKLAKYLTIGDKIIWTGEFAWDSEMASLYLHAADACVLPFANGVTLSSSSLAAAAAHSLPIVTTKGEILESAFIDQKNVVLCLPQDPESLAATIDSLIDNHELRQRLSVGATELAREWFSWEKAIEGTIGALKRQRGK
ncbi:MAG: hypothetical protein DMG05_17075 [Acidobacteria bacterium]|nr:MAG: hypothetical protein DMG05_17075 [Acidobacteriota bacterium]